MAADTSSVPEKPLKVKVAEAIGWTQVQDRYGNPPYECRYGNGDEWMGTRPGDKNARGTGRYAVIPPYGEDSPEGWAATGPLISRYRISLFYGSSDFRNDYAGKWSAGCWGQYGARIGLCDTPLEAVCNLVIALLTAKSLTEKD